MVGFSDSVTVFDANNESRELRLHPDGKFYDAQDDQESDILGNESLHLSEADDETEFIDAFSTMPIGNLSNNMISLSTLNTSVNDLWDDSFEFGGDGNASMSQFQDTTIESKPVPMENSMTLEDLPNLVAASNANGSSDSISSAPKKEEDEPEEDPTRQFVKQMGYGLMLQGGLQFAINPLIKIGKRLFSSDENEEDILEDAAAAQMIMNRSGQLQHNMTTRAGDFSNFAHASAHESSRNMTGAFVLQQDVTTKVMKQAMIQAAQSAGASVGQGAATMTVAASAGAAAGGATAVAAGGAAAAATMSAKFAIGVAVGSIIAVGGLGGATLGSYMGEKELNVDVSTPVFAKQELASYGFDTLDLAAAIAPTVSPESWNSLGNLPTSSPNKDFGYHVDPTRPLPLSPVSTPTTSTSGSPVMAPTLGSPGVPVGGLAGNPAMIIATQHPAIGIPIDLASFIPSTSPIPTSSNEPTGEFVPYPALTPSPTILKGILTTLPTVAVITDPTGTLEPTGRAVTTDSPALSNPIVGSSSSPSTILLARTAMPTQSPTINFGDSPVSTFTGTPTLEPNISSPVQIPTAGDSPVRTFTGTPTLEPNISSPVQIPTATNSPLSSPSLIPTVRPSTSSALPTPATATADSPSSIPSSAPLFATTGPTNIPSVVADEPTSVPSFKPSLSIPASLRPTTFISFPSTSPSNDSNIDSPSSTPTSKPTFAPTTDNAGSLPISLPSSSPTIMPRPSPTTGNPVRVPNMNPVGVISEMPSLVPSDYPSFAPSVVPTVIPTSLPTNTPTSNPSAASQHPSSVPSVALLRPPATTGSPMLTPVSIPPVNPLTVPTDHPSSVPSPGPTSLPTNDPTSNPSGTTGYPTSVPSSRPSSMPTSIPTKGPTDNPTVAPVVVPVPTELQPVPVAPSPVVAPVPIAPQPTPVAPSPVGTGPVGSIIGFSLVDGGGNVLIPFLFQGQTINTAVYGTNLRVRALYLTIWGPVNSVTFDIDNNNGGGSSSIWSRPGPVFETDNRFLRYSSVSIKAIPLPSNSNQGNKGVEVRLNLSIIGTIS
ncbi:hypothetical protein FisN_15Lh252 [Fistulifera solaris]|uniref:Uncharacterized protein n=1 Tax=Fistulifera solaris TaxID=1519565 RepID=A0A1Z5JBP4_FISSO|nr:hypothetical protein FisN_15Lh252 [Fistulifera solaris]|eukprot:GAX11322.1 hypothetical protein FisN_15Lh252 [Fistulifera solaris]